MDLQELRAEVDRVDGELISLILRRKTLVTQVAEYKKDNQIPVFAPQREQEVLDRLEAKAGHSGLGGLRLIYGILMDFNKFYEYKTFPKDLSIPTGLGGASVRAILPDAPGALCRYLAPLAAAEVSISSISSSSMPGGKLVVDIELVGDIADSSFAAVLSVLSDTAEKFTLL
ncbi:MAG: chorismate mutase [Oscillospiraceae bacterium]